MNEVRRLVWRKNPREFRLSNRLAHRITCEINPQDSAAVELRAETGYAVSVKGAFVLELQAPEDGAEVFFPRVRRDRPRMRRHGVEKFLNFEFSASKAHRYILRI
jgi:hypothetical protein